MSVNHFEPHPPNEEGKTNGIIRWMVETPSGWVGSWDKAALEQFVMPVGEPVAWRWNTESEHGEPLYTQPQPAREWVGLTDEEIETIWKKYKTEFFAIKEVEAKLKEKNT